MINITYYTKIFKGFVWGGNKRQADNKSVTSYGLRVQERVAPCALRHVPWAKSNTFN